MSSVQDSSLQILWTTSHRYHRDVACRLRYKNGVTLKRYAHREDSSVDRTLAETLERVRYTALYLTGL